MRDTDTYTHVYAHSDGEEKKEEGGAGPIGNNKSEERKAHTRDLSTCSSSCVRNEVEWQECAFFFFLFDRSQWALMLKPVSH